MRLDYNARLTARTCVDDRLKQRLTGAVILVVIVVLLVPEMFRGRQAAESVPVAAAPAAAPIDTTPVRTVTLDSAATPGGSTPAAPSEAAARPPSDGDAEVLAAHPPATPPPVPSEAPPAAPPPAAPAAAAAGKGWVVQVGSFGVRENAERMVKQGSKAGLKLLVAGPDDKGFYRVRSAVLHDHAAAVRLQAHYRELGFKGLIYAAP
jgi:DedD protein